MRCQRRGNGVGNLPVDPKNVSIIFVIVVAQLSEVIVVVVVVA